MKESPVALRDLIVAFFVAQVIVLCSFLMLSFDKSTKIVFCDVGQGDAAYIRIKNRFDIVVDAGPDNKILSCLGKYMPFYDRKIELAILTHPQLDHYGGFLYLVDRFHIDNFATINIDSKSQKFKSLKQKLKNKKVSFSFPVSGKVLNILGDQLNFYWPTKNTNINKVANNINDDVLIFLFKENGFSALFTADATYRTLNSINLNGRVDILKIPHHGSKNGLNNSFLNLADPSVAVISVGKNNSYGHPHQDVLDLLKAKHIDIRRTDRNGDIIFKLPN